MKTILKHPILVGKRQYVSPRFVVMFEDMEIGVLNTSQGTGVTQVEGEGDNERAKETPGFYEPYTVDFGDDDDY